MPTADTGWSFGEAQLFVAVTFLVICDRSFGADASFLYPSFDQSLRTKPGVDHAKMGGRPWRREFEHFLWEILWKLLDSIEGDIEALEIEKTVSESEDVPTQAERSAIERVQSTLKQSKAAIEVELEMKG